MGLVVGSDHHHQGILDPRFESNDLGEENGGRFVITSRSSLTHSSSFGCLPGQLCGCEGVLAVDWPNPFSSTPLHLILSLCHSVTLSPSHPLTLTPSHPHTLTPSHPHTFSPSPPSPLTSQEPSPNAPKLPSPSSTTSPASSSSKTLRRSPSPLCGGSSP